jgi:SPP1 gp7 family putative phage head morphogenesis protein
LKTLRAQHLKDSDYRSVEKQLCEIFYAIVFGPMQAEIEKFSPQPVGARTALLNADGSFNPTVHDPLTDALRAGKIQYQDGVFSGDFEAATGRILRGLGATFDRHEKVYRLAVGKVPGWVKAASTAYTQTSKLAHNLLKDKLDEITRHLDHSVDNHTVEPNEAMQRVAAGFKETASALAINPQLSELSRKRLSAEYTENMKLWIKKFSQQSILDLRKIVDQNAMQGYRFDKLIGQIKGRYGVTTRKAKFLARQETALFMSKYRQERFSEAGVQKYTWSTSHDSRVRHDHLELNGITFAYSSPPVVDRNTGKRANPGQDYNCRCVDIPILTPHISEVAA